MLRRSGPTPTARSGRTRRCRSPTSRPVRRTCRIFLEVASMAGQTGEGRMTWRRGNMDWHVRCTFATKNKSAGTREMTQCVGRTGAHASDRSTVNGTEYDGRHGQSQAIGRTFPTSGLYIWAASNHPGHTSRISQPSRGSASLPQRKYSRWT